MFFRAANVPEPETWPEVEPEMLPDTSAFLFARESVPVVAASPAANAPFVVFCVDEPAWSNAPCADDPDAVPATEPFSEELPALPPADTLPEALRLSALSPADCTWL